MILITASFENHWIRGQIKATFNRTVAGKGRRRAGGERKNPETFRRHDCPAIKRLIVGKERTLRETPKLLAILTVY